VPLVRGGDRGTAAHWAMVYCSSDGGGVRVWGYWWGLTAIGHRGGGGGRAIRLAVAGGAAVAPPRLWAVGGR
jgi:hypothetical protein